MPNASWRLMQPSDLPDIMRIAELVHPDYPEHPTIFMERQQLYPQGCWVRQHENQVLGYLISHPWRLGQPPALNSLLQELPKFPDTYYLHDIALLPAARGSMATTQILANIRYQAKASKLNSLSLIAVNHSTHFWQRQAFHPANHLVSQKKLRSYDGEACYMVHHLSLTRRPDESHI